jgi:hypothetical protein
MGTSGIQEKVVVLTGIHVLREVPFPPRPLQALLNFGLPLPSPIDQCLLHWLCMRPGWLGSVNSSSAPRKSASTTARMVGCSSAGRA